MTSKKDQNFFAALRTKIKSPEVFGPIKNKKGITSTSWSECLENWASFYENLYSGDATRTFKPIPVKNPELDEPFTYSDLVLTINEFKDNKAPGDDFIVTDDLTALLHTDPEDPEVFLKNKDILYSILSLISLFWSNEKVPPLLKKSILRPFLKGGEVDSTDPSNYRPISLLNTIMKLYEGLIKRRLVRKLESDGLLSSAQAAYKKNLSTSDQLFVLARTNTGI